MGERKFSRHGIIRAAPVILLAGFVAACGGGSSGPAPVVLRGAAPPGFAEGAPMSPPTARPRAEGQRIVVEHGQSLSGIARVYHVSEREIIAANHLTPPYKIEAGQHLLIPGTAVLRPPQLAAAPPAAPPAAPTAQGHPPPEIIPLDGPSPVKSIPPPPGTAGLTPPSEAAPPQRPSPEPSAAEEARGETASAVPLPHGGRFPWPVRGHVLAGYGVTANGTHNDGINIAAPRGTPVTAVDAGTVAYAGNELRGYGNLVLIKHANGWITAYAHCEELLVKRGDTVSRGQVIAKVGATGGVSEPQLHFELRRGKRAVDPREFLAPAPSAGEMTHQG
jgi:murein DD-endopeptidase MepM/ murein hydrolase activator NlpD